MQFILPSWSPMLLGLDKNRMKMKVSTDLTSTTQRSTNPTTEYQQVQAIRKMLTFHNVAGFILEMHIIHHIKLSDVVIHMITSVNAEKALDRPQGWSPVVENVLDPQHTHTNKTIHKDQGSQHPHGGYNHLCLQFQGLWCPLLAS